MPYIPPQVATNELSKALTATLGPSRQGKVRDTYTLPGHSDKLLVVATDRISIFDFVLGALVPDKGAVLTAMTVFWLNALFADIKHHLVAFGKGIDGYLPENLRNNADLQGRALVVKKLEMLPIECVVRGYLTGSGWTAYQKTGVTVRYLVLLIAFFGKINFVNS